MADQNITAKKNNFISRLVDQAAATKQAIEDLQALREEYDDNGYGGGGNAIVQDDIMGDNIHMSVGLIASTVTSATAIRDFMVTNNHDDVLAQASR